MASRRLEDLIPEARQMAQDHILQCADAGIELLIYCTLRDTHEQARLYRQSRTKEQVQAKIDQYKAKGFPALGQILKDVGPQKLGPKVTGAGPGESFHQYSRAYDCVPVLNGKPVWSAAGEGGKLWQKVGQLGKKIGFEWAGDWTSFREFPHFQFTGGLTLQDLMKQKFGPAPVAAPAGGFGLAGAETAEAMGVASTESDALRQALGEANTVFLVFGLRDGGPKERDVREKFGLASRVANGSLSSGLWRTFLVQDPGSLDQDLADLIWPGGDTSPAVLLGLGTGLERQRVRGLQLDELRGATVVAHVFSQG